MEEAPLTGSHFRRTCFCRHMAVQARWQPRRGRQWTPLCSGGEWRTFDERLRYKLVFPRAEGRVDGDHTISRHVSGNASEIVIQSEWADDGTCL